MKQLAPTKARGRFSEKYYTDPEWIAEEKYDGDRRIAQFEDGEIRFTGTRVSVKDGLYVEKTANIPHLSRNMIVWPASNELVDLDFRMKDCVLDLEGTVLDGEMIIPEGFVTGAGGRSKHVTSIMGSLPDEAIRKQKERGWLRYAVFDILFHKGDDLRHMPLTERRKVLQGVLFQWKNPHAFAVPQVKGYDKRAFLESIWAAGGEGIILKHVSQKYPEHLKWVKVKFEANADVVVMGVKQASELSKKVTGEVSMTKYAAAGLIGAIVFGQYVNGELVEMGSTSGMDEQVRKDVSDNPNVFIGTTLEIKHYGREPTGAFRHPQFKGWRPDKNPADCIYYPEEI